MPTPRSPDVDKRSEERKKAEQKYLESKGEMKLVDIASELGVPANKIRKWKSMDDWESKLRPSTTEKSKKKEVERSTKKKGERSTKKEPDEEPRKRGAPKGNKNAVGGKGNKYAVPPDVTKHGGYSKVYWDTLSEEERQMIEEMPKDEETLLIEQIQLYSIRERRIMIAINKYRNSDAAVSLSYTQRSETKRTFDGTKEEQEWAKETYDERIKDKIDNRERLPGRDYTILTQTENKDNIIARLESELSNVQSKKTKSIEALYKLRSDRAKMEQSNTGNEVVNDWISAVLGEGEE